MAEGGQRGRSHRCEVIAEEAEGVTSESRSLSFALHSNGVNRRRSTARHYEQVAKTITHSVEVSAPPDLVWRILVDFSSFPEWNPFIVQAQGEAEAGSRLKVRIQPRGKRAMTFRPVVQEAVPPNRLRWIGHLLVPGLFDGEHSFLAEESGSGTRFTQSETFRGVFVPLSEKSLTATREGFEAMNEALKRRAESNAVKSRYPHDTLAPVGRRHF